MSKHASEIAKCADKLARKYGRSSYDQLCKQRNVPFENAGKAFIAGFVSGAYTALKATEISRLDDRV